MLGQTEGECSGLVLRGEALVALGRHDDARSSAETGLAMARRLENAEYTAYALSVLGLAHQGAGDLDDAEAAFLGALEAGRDLPAYVTFACGRLASLYLVRGDAVAAEAYAQRCAAGGIPLWQCEGRLVRAELGLARGEPGAAAAAAELLAEIEEGGSVGRPAYVRVKRLLAAAAPSSRTAPVSSHRERKVCLFSDIVRSTNLVEALGDEAWGHLLRWHDETLRSLFASYTGQEVKQVGDGFFVVFERAVSAIECAVAIQRALERHRREHGFSPQVRIGLHEAQIVREGHDYHGSGVHVAARIGALAEAGEILASRPLADGVGVSRVSAVRTVTLRGIARPVEVVSIYWV
jgi:class 3 adenylate cyclase